MRLDRPAKSSDHRRKSLLLVFTLWIATLLSCDPAQPPNLSVHADLAEQDAQFEKTVIEVTDGVHVAVGFGLANSVLIEGDGANIIVDAMGGRSEAREVLAAFREISDQPAAALILTHYHPDHSYGAAAFIDAESSDFQLWAHASTGELMDRLVNVVAPSLYLRSMHMFGQFLPDEQRTNAGIGAALGYDQAEVAPARPTHVVEDRAEIEIAGVRLELVHAPGETADQIFVWLPDRKVLLPGDNIYRAFPNLYTIRGTPYRDVALWVESLDAMRALGAEHLIPSHTRPLSGADAVMETLTAYRDAIQFVHDQTVRGINAGKTADELAESLRLPPHLENHPWLKPIYGRVDWSVRAIYGGIFGWFDGNPSHLVPLSDAERAARWEAALAQGGSLQSHAERAVRDGDEAWALELADLMIARGWVGEGNVIKARALTQLAADSGNANERHYMLSFARHISGVPLAALDTSTAPDEFVEQIPVDRFMNAIPVRLKAENAIDVDRLYAFEFADDRRYLIHVRRGVAEVDPPEAALGSREPDLTIETDSLTWKRIALRKTGPLEEIQAGSLVLDADLGEIVQFMRLFERP